MILIPLRSIFAVRAVSSCCVLSGLCSGKYTTPLQFPFPSIYISSPILPGRGGNAPSAGEDRGCSGEGGGCVKVMQEGTFT